MTVEVKRVRGTILLDEAYCGPGRLKIDGKGYAQISIPIGAVNGVQKDKKILLHRYLTNAPKGMTVDHINGNRLDNRMSNLRVCSMGQNNMNKPKYSSNKSGYRGVSWKRDAGKWVAQIQAAGQKRFLGYFTDPSEAYSSYLTAARELHGEYSNEAKLNKDGRLVNG